MAKKYERDLSTPLAPTFGGPGGPKNATADSTNYYRRRVMSNMNMEFRSKGELKEIYRKKLNQSVDDLNRQKRKGKPGYDKNGFPVKK
jgi:hypothetical protein